MTFVQKLYVLPKCFIINPNQGDEVWSSGFGTADFSSQTRVDNNTLFNIGSVTKSFTATLLGMLLKDNGYVKIMHTIIIIIISIIIILIIVNK